MKFSRISFGLKRHIKQSITAKTNSDCTDINCQIHACAHESKLEVRNIRKSLLENIFTFYVFSGKKLPIWRFETFIMEKLSL
jgi:hypothetical protein